MSEALKVATFNVNGVNGRLPRLLEWLEETQPDVACLQEIKTSDEKVPATAIEAAGYQSIWRGQRSHHGVAVLSKGLPMRERRRVLPGDDKDVQARYSRWRWAGSSSPRCISPTATRCRARTSTTSSPGSSG